jgi:hypothetical protein
VIVERKDILDLLPLAMFGRDPGSTLSPWLGYKLVDDPKTLGLVQGLCAHGGGEVLVGRFGADAIDPVIDADVVSIDLGYRILNTDRER